LPIKKETWAEYLKESISYPEGTKFPFYQPHHVLVPITYITPNYFSIRTLAITSALTNLGHTVSLLIHDNNIVAHKYISSNKLMRQRTISGGYPGYLIEEIWRLLEMFGAEKDRIRVIKSSDIWLNLTKDTSLYLEFYSMLARLKLSKDELTLDKPEPLYRFIERPFDIYLSKNYRKVTKYDMENPTIFLLNWVNYVPSKKILQEFSKIDREKEEKRFLMLSMHDLPLIEKDDQIPSCGMSLAEIKDIVAHNNPSNQTIEAIEERFIRPVSKLMQTLDITESKEGKAKRNRAPPGFCERLYLLLSNIDDQMKNSERSELREMVVSSSIDFENIQGLLSSRRVISVLRFCDGEYTISEIAKKSGLQLSNASQYINKLRESGIISMDRKPRILVSDIIIPSRFLLDAK
jgi:predicted transcriptional regulator